VAEPEKWEQIKTGKPPQSDIKHAQDRKKILSAQYLSGMLKHAHLWERRAQLEDPALDPRAVYQDIKRARDKMLAEVSEPRGECTQRAPNRAGAISRSYRATKKHGPPDGMSSVVSPAMRALKIKQDLHYGNYAPLNPAKYFTGVATNPTVKFVLLDEPDDNDSTREIQAAIDSDSTADVLCHHAYIHDQTHFWSHDEAEVYEYWLVFGYQLPRAPVDGRYGWYAHTSHYTGLAGNAEHRVYWTRWLSFPPWEAAEWPDADPSSLTDFGPQSYYTYYDPDNPCNSCYGDPGGYSWHKNLIWVDNSMVGGNVYYYDDPSEAVWNVGWEPGLIDKSPVHVTQGQSPKVWIGCRIGLSCREGTAEIPWSCIRVFSDYDFIDNSSSNAPPTWLPTRPGINYWFFPD
jgi:hypothetical protein